MFVCTLWSDERMKKDYSGLKDTDIPFVVAFLRLMTVGILLLLIIGYGILNL